MNLSAAVTVLADDAVIGLTGDVDMSTVPVLQDSLRKALALHPGRRLVVDLDGVIALDDVGLGVILGAAGAARRNGGDVEVVANNQRLRERLDVTGFSRAVHVRERASK